MSDPDKRKSAALTDGPERAAARAMLKGIGFTDEDLARPIVGVVRDVKLAGLEAPSEPAYYIPASQAPLEDMTILVRTTTDPLSIVGALRQAVWSIDPNQPISSVSRPACGPMNACTISKRRRCHARWSGTHESKARLS